MRSIEDKAVELIAKHENFCNSFKRVAGTFGRTEFERGTLKHRYTFSEMYGEIQKNRQKTVKRIFALAERKGA